MPLTLAHPAAVLPLRRLGLPMSALVLGSMVPDIPVFFGEYGLYDTTHSWVGLVTVDLVAVVVGLVLWFRVIRDPVVDLSPRAVRDRLAACGGLDRRGWLLVPPAAVLGSATHVAWDSFTHANVWGTEHLGWLREEHLGLAGYRWAQYVSGVVGLAVVVVAAVGHLRGLRQVRTTTGPRALRSWTLPGTLATALAAGLGVAVARIPDGLLLTAFDGVVTSVVATVGLTVVVSVVWQVQIRRPGTRAPT